MSSKNNTRLCSCLFVKLDGEITTVLYENGRSECIRFNGETSRKFDGGFWEEWINAVSYESGTAVDFCIIYDELPEIPERLSGTKCSPEQSVWTPQTIAEALKQANIRRRILVKNEPGYVIADYSVYFPQDRTAELKAVFPNSEKYLPSPEKPKKTKAPKESEDKNSPEKSRKDSGISAAEKPVEQVRPAHMPADGQTKLAQHFQQKLKEDEERKNR